MRILYVYPCAMAGELRKVETGQAPSDRMYGLVELRERGHQVDFTDTRFRGRYGALQRRLRNYANLCDAATLHSLRQYDVVVVKDAFSTMLTAACRMRGTKVVYLDALFDLPRRAWTRAFAKANLMMAHGNIAYSRRQIDAWAQMHDLPSARFTYMPYCIDMRFYQRPLPAAGNEAPYVLSIGRDMGRRFDTLVHAMEGLGIRLKLVTLPYLLKDFDASRPFLDVLQHISYDELFRLYAGALLVAVPLKRNITYPSGIRGLLEALAVGKSVVASRTPVLEEYVPEGSGVTYVDPEDPGALREAICALRDGSERRAQLEQRGRQLVASRFDMPVFAEALDSYLTQSVSAATVATAVS